MASRRVVNFQASLLANMALLVAALGGLLLVTSIVTTNRAVEDLSGALTDRVLAQTESRLSTYFEPVLATLEVAGRRAASAAWRGLPVDRLDSYFTPLLEQLPQLVSVLVAQQDGTEYMLLEDEGRWRSRFTRPELGAPALIREWIGHQGTPDTRQEVLDYDARRRPWFATAMSRWSELGEFAPLRRRIAWTPPYTLFTSQRAGITASLAVTTAEGDLFIVAFDLLLADISRFTSQLSLGRSGKVFVLRGVPEQVDDVVLLGLPADERFTQDADLDRFVLRKPEDLGGVLADFMAQGPFQRRGAVRFESDGQGWWGELKRYNPQGGEVLWIGALMPESELLARLPRTTRFVAIATGLFVLFAVLRALRVARLYATPLAALVQRSERMQRLDFRPSEPVDSHIAEVRRLGSTLEAARSALMEYSAVREDTRVARSLREMTLPVQPPGLLGWELASWHEPGEDVDGEVHDAVLALDGALLLLAADLPGTGVATALLGAELRAAFRATVGAGLKLSAVAETLDRFVATDLAMDLPVPAWLARVEPVSGLVELIGAGHDDLLHKPVDEPVRRLVAAGQALGTGGPGAPCHARLGPGDALVYASDGVLDALDEQRQRFGHGGLERVLARALDASAADLVAAVREQLATHATGRRRDRTVLVLKSSAG